MLQYLLLLSSLSSSLSLSSSSSPLSNKGKWGRAIERRRSIFRTCIYAVIFLATPSGSASSLLGYTPCWSCCCENRTVFIPDTETDLLVCWMFEELVSMVTQGLSSVLGDDHLMFLEFILLLI